MKAALIRLFTIAFTLTAWALLSCRVCAHESAAMPSATEVSVSEYSSNNFSLVMQVRAGHVFEDYEHWGFFRIGVLPIVVIENVQIKVQSAEYLASVVRDLRSSLQPRPGYRGIELRNVEVAVIGRDRPQLRAATAWLGGNGLIDLSDVTVLKPDGRQLHLPKAAVHISGRSAGQLFWRSGKRQEAMSILSTTIKS